MKTIALFLLVIVGGIFINSFKNNYSQTKKVWRPVVKKLKVRNKPFSVEIADLNGDKIKDLVIANGEDSSVTILIGTGKGNFSEAKGSPFAAGYMPNDIAIADFNKDGKPDLAFANHDRKYLTVLTEDGSGNFTPLKGSPFPVDVKPHTHGLIAGDFNSDSNIDLVTDSWGNNRLAVLFGNNDHGFNAPVKYLEVGKHPYQRVRAADLNKDGNLDLITTNLDGDNTTILLGDGKGNFKEAAGSPFACGDSPFGVAVGDIDHDGNLDLAIINSPTITSENKGHDGLTILMGDGKGTFKPMPGSPFATGKSPSRLAIGDLNGDGIKDIAVTNYNSNNITVFIMNKHGVTTSHTIKTGIFPSGIAIADLNGDGKGDIVVSNSGEYYVDVIFSN
ncbi:VCBS repeat-containing protein [Mucilaginibacter sp.]|uniref:FG-GAP repeat domain-containing protein n=1 Tax=Mucilaginibacter sp. TaxID=1882438 RepID=UPI002618609F|nr:VCBS repeat-containing protein [Mucilaginibacter sp.]MDB4923460.1 repeat-containing protein [Mucilaginibacter sp.]